MFVKMAALKTNTKVVSVFVLTCLLYYLSDKSLNLSPLLLPAIIFIFLVTFVYYLFYTKGNI